MYNEWQDQMNWQKKEAKKYDTKKPIQLFLRLGNRDVPQNHEDELNKSVHQMF